MEEKPKKGKVLKVIGGILGGLIILGLIIPSEDKQTATSTPAKESRSDNMVNVGIPIDIGEVQWIVTKAEKKTIIKGAEYADAAKPNGVFVVVHLTAELKGNESGTVDSSQLRIIDNKGRKFKTSDNVNVVTQLGDSWMFLKQVDPNVPISGMAVFDVATDAEGLVLEIDDLKTFSTAKGTIILDI